MTVSEDTKNPLPKPSRATTVTTAGIDRVTISSVESIAVGSSAPIGSMATGGGSPSGGAGARASSFIGAASRTTPAAGPEIGAAVPAGPPRSRTARTAPTVINATAATATCIRRLPFGLAAAGSKEAGASAGLSGDGADAAVPGVSGSAAPAIGRAHPHRHASSLLGTLRAHCGQVHTNCVVIRLSGERPLLSPTPRISPSHGLGSARRDETGLKRTPIPRVRLKPDATASSPAEAGRHRFGSG